MKVIKITLVAMVLTLGAAAQKKVFKLEGTAPASKEGAKVYLDYQNESGSVADSAIIKNGKFSFKGTVDEPSYSRMILDHKNQGKYWIANVGDRLFFYLANENYKIEIKDSVQSARITGSPTQAAFQSYIKEIGGDFMVMIEAAKAAMAAIPQNAPDANERAKAVYDSFEQKFEDRRLKEIEFAKRNPGSIFSIDALTDAANKHPLSSLEPVFLALTDEVRSLRGGKALDTRILAEKTIKIGNIAPAFSQADTSGKLVHLADYRGQYVLVDFWASWCKPCRAENPNLKKAYDKYKDKLTVIGVSLDDKDTRDAWIAAIHKDDLPWVHVSDLKGWSNEIALRYGVRAVPQNYLLDKEGKIIASNLRDERLHEVLSDVLSGKTPVADKAE